jgi:hypothetical protein
MCGMGGCWRGARDATYSNIAVRGRKLRSKLLGRGGTSISVIGFGAWEVGIDGSVVAQERAVRAIHAGVDAGMNWIDTSSMAWDFPNNLWPVP